MGKPNLVRRRAAIDRALSREDEAAGIDPRGWIRSLIEARGDDPSFARGDKRFSITLSSPKHIRVLAEIIELPEGAEVTVFRYLGAERRRWPARSTNVLAVVTIRDIAGYQDRQITVTMAGRATMLDLTPTD